MTKLTTEDKKFIEENDTFYSDRFEEDGSFVCGIDTADVKQYLSSIQRVPEGNVCIPKMWVDIMVEALEKHEACRTPTGILKDISKLVR